MYASSHACSVYLLDVTSHDGIPEFEMSCDPISGDEACELVTTHDSSRDSDSQVGTGGGWNAEMINIDLPGCVWLYGY